MTTSRGDKAFIHFVDSFDMTGFSAIENTIINCGARSCIAKLKHFKLVVVELEGAVSVDQFRRNVAGVRVIDSVEPVRTLRFSASSKRSLPGMKVFHDKVLTAWHLVSLGARHAYKSSTNGMYSDGFGIRLGVVDTGIGFHPDLPCTDVERVRRELLEVKDFWQKRRTQDILYELWKDSIAPQQIFRQRILDLEVYVQPYVKLASLATFTELRELYADKQMNKAPKFRTGASPAVLRAYEVKELTLGDFKEYLALRPSPHFRAADPDLASFETEILPSLLEEFFNANRLQITNECLQLFRSNSNLEVCDDVIYRSRIWMTDPKLRQISSRSKSFVAHDLSLMDYDGHGTAVAGIIASAKMGLAKDCELVILKIYDYESRQADTGYLVASIEYAIDAGIDIVLIGAELVGEESRALEKACDIANSKGVLLIAPSGNGGLDVVSAPAAYPEVVAVASVSSDCKRSWFNASGMGSNIGREVDLAAFGGGHAVGSVMEEDLIQRWEKCTDILTTRNGGGLEACAGTTFAAAQVAAAAAVLKSKVPDATVSTLKAALLGCLDWKCLDGVLRTNEAGRGVLDFSLVYMYQP
jgi:subtilisin family serine protease